MGVLNHTSKWYDKNFNKLSEDFERSYYRVTMLVKNKRGVLTKISGMLSDHGAGVDKLDFKPFSKKGLAHLQMTISASTQQLRSILNDSRKMSEIKTASLEVSQNEKEYP